VSNILVFEGSHDMVDTISISDVAQKVVTKTFTLGGSFDDTSNINNLKNGSNLGFRLEHGT